MTAITAICPAARSFRCASPSPPGCKCGWEARGNLSQGGCKLRYHVQASVRSSPRRGAVNTNDSQGSRRMQFRVSPNTRNDSSAEEWQARVDLAAAHRLAFNQGFSEGIFNHLTLTVPSRSDRYYQIPFGMHWSEVTASSFMEVGIDDGEVKRGEGEVERSCYCIHAPIHHALPQANTVFHTHMPYASALTRL